MVLSVDEKTQIQAFDRTQPMLQLASINGESGEFRLFFSTPVSFLIRLQASGGEADGQTAERVRKSHGSFLSRGGHAEPDDLSVEPVYDEESGADLLSISFTPPRDLLKSGPITFSLKW